MEEDPELLLMRQHSTTTRGIQNQKSLQKHLAGNLSINLKFTNTAVLNGINNIVKISLRVVVENCLVDHLKAASILAAILHAVSLSDEKEWISY